MFWSVDVLLSRAVEFATLGEVRRRDTPAQRTIVAKVQPRARHTEPRATLDWNWLNDELTPPTAQPAILATQARPTRPQKPPATTATMTTSRDPHRRRTTTQHARRHRHGTPHTNPTTCTTTR